jgi:putative RNA 2'-phosphotransferase
MIRATYGHTIDIRLDDLPLAEIDDFYYPVTEEEIDIILEGGLNPIDRKHVHLSGSMEKAIEAGKVRTEIPLILHIDGKNAREDGVKIYHAGKDVYITDRIDAKYISKAEVSDIITSDAASTTEEETEEVTLETIETEEMEEKPSPKPKRKSTKKTKKTKTKK